MLLLLLKRVLTDELSNGKKSTEVQKVLFIETQLPIPQSTFKKNSDQL